MAVLCAGCASEEEIPTGVHLTIVSATVLSAGGQIDGFHIRTRVEDQETVETQLPIEGRLVEGTESVHLVFGHDFAGLTVSISVDGFDGETLVGGGRVEAVLRRRKLVAAEVVIRTCAAVEGPYCEESVLVSCDSADRTVRTECAYGCNQEAARCNECGPEAAACQGEVFVVCGDDGLPATSEDCAALTEACRAGQCTASGCVTTPSSDGTACDDGLFCTADTTCNAGACGGGTPNLCSDDNGCTFDTCDEASDACFNDSAPMDGTACDDGNFCLVGETCLDGSCGGGNARVCDDDTACTFDSCDEVNDTCDADPTPLNGTFCEDSEFCTLMTQCDDGVCGSGATRPCDDGNSCTQDTCDDTDDICVNDGAPLDGSGCDDGFYCTQGTTCSDGVCGGGAPLDCNDNEPCTFDTCDEASQGCVHDDTVFEGAPCDDGTYCVVNKVCTSGACGGGSLRNCDDDDVCTDDSCDEIKRACQNASRGDGTACEDGDYCTVGETCTGGVCSNGATRGCDDGNPCTTDSCDEDIDQCLNTDAGDGLPCDDGSYCVENKTCAGGSCSGGTPLDCEDGNPCTFDTCDEAARQCVADNTTFNGASCSNGDHCVVGETCSNGSCGGGDARDCDDDDSCTTDTCNETSNQCDYAYRGDGAACDDGAFCTVGDTCLGNACQGGAASPCADGNPCTVDDCDEDLDQCLNTAETDGVACDDGSYCIENKTCTGGSCSGGTPLDCEDGNSCTFDTCDEAARQCVADNTTFNGASCSNGDHCVVGETCSNGSCGGGDARDCDDDDSCTTDTCNETSNQCDYAYRGDGAACDDGAFCTVGDTCLGNACQGGAASPCADGNPCMVDTCDEGSDACSYACAPASKQCVSASEEATCDGTCDPPAVRYCLSGCNSTRQECNECVPSTTVCQADLSLLCNAEVACDVDGLISDRRCCTSNRCTCDGSVCLEDKCTAAPDLSGGGSLVGNTCSADDDVPGDCLPGGLACRHVTEGGAPEDFFKFTLDDDVCTSGFCSVTLDASSSDLDTVLRVSTVCGSETTQVSSAETCALPPATEAGESCVDLPGPDIMVLCGLPEGTYYGAIDGTAGDCDPYDLDLTVVPVSLDVPAEAGNISAGGIFTGNTCDAAYHDDFSFPGTRLITGCTGTDNCVGDVCPDCSTSAATDCAVGSLDSLCSYNGSGGNDAVFYLALEVDSGIDISTDGSDFDTVLYLMETGSAGASPPGAVQVCNDDCLVPDGPSHIQTSLKAGLYYVYLDGASGACGNFMLSVTVAPAATCPNLSCEFPFENCVNCPGDCPCTDCGDGVVDHAAGEECDDGGNADGDGCSAHCIVEPDYKCFGSPSSCWPRCGDGVLDAEDDEECDDDNLDAGDGCDATCMVEAGFLCTGAPSFCVPGVSITACPRVTIPDADATGIDEVINVPDDFVIGDITVDVEILHTYIGDLTVSLTSPDSTTVTLHNGSGSNGDDIIGNYDLTIAPDGPGAMADFDGETAAGAWTLHMADDMGPDEGTLECWTVNLFAAAVCPNTVCEFGENCVDCAADCDCLNCGDGVVQRGEGEECDDGNTQAGDGCSSLCVEEHLFMCEGQPSVCTPGLRVTHCPYLTIPDNTPGGVSDTIDIPDDFMVGDVTVDVAVSHTYIGDVVLELWSPEGTTVRLHDQSGDADDDIVGNYDLSLAPDGPGAMSDFDGESATGTWTFFGADVVVFIDGTIECWTLNLTPASTCNNGTCEGGLGETCAGCPTDCTCPNCPDGTVDVAEGERCDDDNGTAGDGCSLDCDVEPDFKCSGEPSICIPACGDGVLDSGEACDDGDAQAGDGCDASCVVESGYFCSGEPSVCRVGYQITSCPSRKIRDNRPQGVTSAINQADACVVANVTVDVEILHTWIGDLEVDLTSPDNITVRLHDHTGGSAEDIIGNYDVEMTPDVGSMSDFDGSDGQGSWELFAADTAEYIEGTLECWTLNVECQ
ncbi:proprotein convertase P-domain-containing protein [Myxococcota bacterium]